MWTVVKLEEVLDFPFRRLPGQVLEAERRELTKLCERLFQLKGEREHILDSLYKAHYLSDPETLLEALRSGELRSASSEMMRLSFSKAEIFDSACWNFLSALKNYATALAYEENNPNVMWCALLSAHGDIAQGTTHLGYLKGTDRSQRHPSAPASPAEAGAMGGEQHGRNHLLVRTHLALLLYQKRPENGWKDSMQAARVLHEPLQRFIDDNRIEMRGAGEAQSLETRIINWLDQTKDGHKDLRTVFKATRCKPST